MLSKVEEEDEELTPVLILALIEDIDEELEKYDKDMNSIVSGGYRRAYNSQVTRVIENIKELEIKMAQPIQLRYRDFRPTATLPLDKFKEEVKVSVTQAFASRSWDAIRALVTDVVAKFKATYSVIGRVLRTYRTQATYMRAMVMDYVQGELDSMGIKVKRMWSHTLLDGRGFPHSYYKPRGDHMGMHGQIEDENGLFHNGPLVTRGPCMFGIPSQDFNCRCVVDFVKV